MNGEFFVQECTKEEYEALAGSGVPNLPKGAKWVCSGGISKYDTVSGFLENGQYAEDGNDILVKIDGLAPVVLSKDDVVSGELKPEIQQRADELKAQKVTEEATIIQP